MWFSHTHGHVQTDTHLQLSHKRAFGVYLQQRHRAETCVTSLWKHFWKGLGITLGYIVSCGGCSYIFDSVATEITFIAATAAL